MKQILTLAALLITSLAVHADITVNGDGKVTATPNKSHITLGVQTDGKTANDAMEANKVAMQRLFDSLKKLGIPDKDVQTVALNLTPKYKPIKDREPELIGYTATHQITITVRKVEETGTVLDVMVKDGANHVQGISFGVEDSEKLLDEARIKAVADARRKARLYAQAAGVGVGRVKTIAEVHVHWAQPKSWSLEEFRMAPAGTPVAKGEQQLSVSVTVVFGIDDNLEKKFDWKDIPVGCRVMPDTQSVQ